MDPSLATFVFIITFIHLVSSQASIVFHPHVVVIRHEGFPICGGGLLTSKAVLTSSQCCERIKSISKTKVIAGTLTWSEADEEVEVRDVIKIGEHEFCHLILKEEFANSQWISPKEMETNKALPELSSPCFMTGWLEDERLSHVNVTITDSKHCVETFNTNFHESNMVCAEAKVGLLAF